MWCEKGFEWLEDEQEYEQPAIYQVHHSFSVWQRWTLKISSQPCNFM